MELGPAGFLFEQYFAAILRAYGYETALNRIVQGECVSHETDIVAEKGKRCYFVEAKYHNHHGVKTNTRTVMYAYARLLDMAPVEARSHERGTEFHMWVATNTKFTNRARRYGRCRGLRLTGWGYPRHESLQDLIEEKILHPVTVLPSINKHSREQLAQQRILFAKDLASYAPEEIERIASVSPKNARQLHHEVEALLNGSDA
jgi:Holliday junction resolvase-like predicted endonuclease